MGFLENPIFLTSFEQVVELYNSKTIMGGLFGGLLGVEIAKKIINESSSSGDLFTFPLIFGIFIGRIGCFLSGVNEFTYGEETTSEVIFSIYEIKAGEIKQESFDMGGGPPKASKAASTASGTSR